MYVRTSKVHSLSIIHKYTILIVYKTQHYNQQSDPHSPGRVTLLDFAIAYVCAFYFYVAGDGETCWPELLY